MSSDAQTGSTFRLSRLFIHPVKSLRGIELEQATLTRRGLAHDRRFMLVDEQGQFVTQRELHAMATIATELVGDRLRLSAPEGPALHVPLTPTEGEPRSVRVFDSQLDALDLGQACADWLARALGRPLRLVFMPDSSVRPLHPKYAQPGDRVSFADGYPFLIIGEASLAELNTRLEAALPMQRFRPNLVVQGSQSFAEDAWSDIHIGGTPFRVVKPCSRCVITTLDPQTGEVRGPSPLKALARYRRTDGQVMFGQNAIADADTAELRVGDPVSVRTLRAPPVFDGAVVR